MTPSEIEKAKELKFFFTEVLDDLQKANVISNFDFDIYKTEDKVACICRLTLYKPELGPGDIYLGDKIEVKEEEIFDLGCETWFGMFNKISYDRYMKLMQKMIKAIIQVHPQSESFLKFLLH